MSLLCTSTKRYPSPPLENKPDADKKNFKMRGREQRSGYSYYNSNPLAQAYTSHNIPHDPNYERVERGVGWPDGQNQEALFASGRSAYAGGFYQQSQVQGQGQGQDPRQDQRQNRWGGGGPDWRFQVPPATPPPEAKGEAGYALGQASWYANAHAPSNDDWRYGASPALLLQQPLTQSYYTDPRAKLNATVPAFVPESVPTASLMKRLSGVNKRTRHNQQQDIGAVAANALQQKKGRPKAPQPQRPQTRASRFSQSAPRLYVMQRPSPTTEYLFQAGQPPQAWDISRPLLVVLDLNGTLLYRSKSQRFTYTERPHLKEFLDYLFSNHKVMVWSSARPDNVQRMCETLFTPEQHKQIVAIWARDTLGLNSFAYNEKVQVYKQLSWVWKSRIIQATNPFPGVAWSQANTVLLDDSIEKAASEPHNIILIEEFEARQDQMEADVLGQVAFYLDILRSQRNASAYMRSQPFVYDPKQPLVSQSEADASYGEEGGVALASA